MKSYPSIPRSTGADFREFDAYVFDKLDGSNLRFEWSKKRGWYKYGTRTRMFDSSDPVFSQAIPVFDATLADPLTWVARDNRWEAMTVFCEFWGSNSFAGNHVPEDPKHLSLFDISVHRKGFLGPKEFLRIAEHPNLGNLTVKYLGRVRWTRGYINKVFAGDIDGITFEGVVGKAGDGHDLIRSKAKTQAWIDAVRARYGTEADTILNS